MKHIKNFSEYTIACNEDNSSSFAQDGVVYKRYFPKENQDDYIYVRDNKELLWKFFNDGYKFANLKEFRSCINPKSLWKNASCLKVVFYNGNLIAASIYTSYQGGMKCVGITATTDLNYRSIGKKAVVNIVKEDISLVGNFYWTECSDAIEHLYEKHGGIKIPNEYLELFIGKRYKSLSDDGYHFSIEVLDGDGEKERVEKVIFGLNSKETFEHIKNKNDERIMKYINGITNVTVKESVYIKNLSREDYYTEVVYVFYEDRINGFKDYSIETINILKEAVEYLKQFIELNKNNKSIDIKKYSTAVWNGDDLVGTTTIMDIHDDILI